MTRLGGVGVPEFAAEVKRLQTRISRSWCWRTSPGADSATGDPAQRAASTGLRLERRRQDSAGDHQIRSRIVLNAEHDTKLGDVRVMLLVENSVRFYSTYLPLIYTEVMKLTQALIADGLNLMHRLLRMRARPRILLAETFEEAWSLYTLPAERFGGDFRHSLRSQR
jgi:hypothetical protein